MEPESENLAPLEDGIKECIMYYLTPAKRLINLHKHPILSTLNESVPLRISLLSLSPTKIIIDSMTFQWGSILLHLNGQPLHQCIKDTNQSGGYPFDVNIFGKELRNAPETPGDIRIYGQTTPEFEGFGRKEPFDVFIRFAGTFEGQKGTVTTIRGAKISDLVKSFTTEYLGTGQVHTVRQLQIAQEPGVLRLPANLKFKVRELFAPANSLHTIEAVTPLLHEDCLPIAVILARVSRPREPIFRNEIFKTAVTLRIGMPENNKIHEWAPSFIGLKNLRIQLFENELHFKELHRIAQNWKYYPKPVGTYFSQCSMKVKKILIALKALLDGRETFLLHRSCPEFPTAVTIEVNDEVELNVYGVKTPGPPQRNHNFPFMVVMEVFRKGFARPVYMTTSV